MFEGKINPHLAPVLAQLLDEGIQVCTYCDNALYWFDGQRILDIQAGPMNHYGRYNNYTLGVSYIPSRKTGSGCGLSGRDGHPAANLLAFRNEPTWVNFQYPGQVRNYTSLEHFMNRETGLNFQLLSEENL